MDVGCPFMDAANEFINGYGCTYKFRRTTQGEDERLMNQTTIKLGILVST